MSIYKSIFKPLFDFFGALILLILLSPIILFVSLILFIQYRGNILFIQKRPGKDARIFKLIKFKTMSDKRDQIGNLLPDIERLTPTGKIIRNTSIDEVLQLINVLKGEMSLVGPRPLLTEYLKHYSEFQARRHEVRPGITGLAQVMGRNKISWKEKFRCDVWYVDNLSFTLDLKILCKTFLNVLRQKDVNQSGDSTMEYFQPNEYEQ